MNDSIITEFDEQTGEWEIVDADMDAMIDRILKPGDGPTVECETIEQRVARQDQLRRIAEMDYRDYLDETLEE